jgi:cytoskeletal protein RodZ
MEQTKATTTTKFKRLSDELQSQRRNKRLSIRKVAAQAHLPESTIRSLENPLQSTIPESRMRGLYRLYADVLGVNPSRVESMLGESHEMLPRLHVPSIIKVRKLIVFSNLTTKTVLLSVLIGVVGYAGWQIISLMITPSLTITNPNSSYSLSNSSIVEVSGQVQAESSVLLNGVPITASGSDYRFSEPVFLQEGLNVIKVAATNNFSRSTERELRIVYQP